MAERNDPDAHMDQERRSAAHVAEQITLMTDLLRGLFDFRRRGRDYDHLVDEIMEVREVKLLRLGWDLWSSLAESDGVDAYALLLELLPAELIGMAHAALHGDAPGDPEGGPHLSLVR